MKKIKVRGSTVLYWLMLNAGILILAAGVYFFKAPNKFATGGVSGLSIILAEFIPLSQPAIMGILNVALLIIGFIFLGKNCSFKTVYCSLVYSAEMELMELLPVKTPLSDQIFLEFVFAMVLTGAGSAIIFFCKASSGGTDIIALIIKKYTNIKNVGKAILLTDFIIAMSSFFIFDVTCGLFSILGLFVKAFLVDGIIEGITRSKTLTIITDRPEVISPLILNNIHRGVTEFKAKGGYTGNEHTVMITVCKRSETLKLKSAIKAADPASFVIIGSTAEVVGRGWASAM